MGQDGGDAPGSCLETSKKAEGPWQFTLPILAKLRQPACGCHCVRPREEKVKPTTTWMVSTHGIGDRILTQKKDGSNTNNLHISSPFSKKHL